jgi:hypothetical protein
MTREPHVRTLMSFSSSLNSDFIKAQPTDRTNDPHLFDGFTHDNAPYLAQSWRFMKPQECANC